MKAKILNKLNFYKQELEEKGYNVVHIGLYGSQNYNLHDEQSDVDARAVVLPTVRQLLDRKSISKVYNFETGQVDVKDVLSFVKILSKGNPSFLESVETEYLIADKEFLNLIQGYEVNPKAVLGMMYQKLSSIKKGLSDAAIYETLGYDPKDIHHILRLSDLFLVINSYSGERNLPCFLQYESKAKQSMLQIKRDGAGTVEEVVKMAEGHIAAAKDLIKDLDFKLKGVSEEIYNYLERELALSLENLYKIRLMEKLGYEYHFTNFVNDEHYKISYGSFTNNWRKIFIPDSTEVELSELEDFILN